MSAVSGTRRPDRDQRRAAVADRFLNALEEIVRRHRALALDPDHINLHAELITAEVAHQLNLARRELERHPRITPPTEPRDNPNGEW